MKHLLFFILFVAFSCQQTTFSETENLKTSKSEKVLKIFQVFNFSDSQVLNFSDSQIQKDSQVLNFSDSKKSSQVLNFSDSQIQKDSQVFSFSDSQILYFENQIRLADSLYKNYLPQYNFDEVKAAVMFFDSCEPRTMSNETFLESENLKNSESEKGCEQRAMSNEQRFRKAQSSQLEARSSKHLSGFQFLRFSDSK